MKILYAGPDDGLVMRTSGEGRKPGLHLSDITKRLVFERDTKLNPESPIDAMVLERGFTWERVLESALAARHERPGYRPDQLQEDGVWMSPDWLNEDSDIHLEEWKATKKSLNQVKEKGFGQIGWTWLYNTQSYLRALLRRKLTDVFAVRIRVWFMNGDYSYESKTSDYHLLNDYWRFDLGFDKRELEENWQAIIAAGKRYGLLKRTSDEDVCPKKTPRTPSFDRLQRSSVKGRIVTFPRGRTSSRSSNA